MCHGPPSRTFTAKRNTYVQHLFASKNVPPEDVLARFPRFEIIVWGLWNSDVESDKGSPMNPRFPKSVDDSSRQSGPSPLVKTLICKVRGQRSVFICIFFLPNVHCTFSVPWRSMERWNTGMRVTKRRRCRKLLLKCSLVGSDNVGDSGGGGVSSPSVLNTLALIDHALHAPLLTVTFFSYSYNLHPSHYSEARANGTAATVNFVTC